ncbi:hypothetical protein C8R44DRAFT_736409 [Mycena epipterygia]|nr:hypothetical protein C8R44DRAFT_736409 [Mycena epipterygia]
MRHDLVLTPPQDMRTRAAAGHARKSGCKNAPWGGRGKMTGCVDLCTVRATERWRRQTAPYALVQRAQVWSVAGGVSAGGAHAHVRGWCRDSESPGAYMCAGGAAGEGRDSETPGCTRRGSAKTRLERRSARARSAGGGGRGRPVPGVWSAYVPHPSAGCELEACAYDLAARADGTVVGRSGGARSAGDGPRLRNTRALVGGTRRRRPPRERAGASRYTTTRAHRSVTLQRGAIFVSCERGALQRVCALQRAKLVTALAVAAPASYLSGVCLSLPSGFAPGINVERTTIAFGAMRRLRTTTEYGFTRTISGGGLAARCPWRTILMCSRFPGAA